MKERALNHHSCGIYRLVRIHHRQAIYMYLMSAWTIRDLKQWQVIYYILRHYN